jgi:hypothetical protein
MRRLLRPLPARRQSLGQPLAGELDPLPIQIAESCDDRFMILTAKAAQSRSLRKGFLYPQPIEMPAEDRGELSASGARVAKESPFDERAQRCVGALCNAPTELDPIVEPFDLRGKFT